MAFLWIKSDTHITIRRHAFEQMFSRDISEEEIEHIIHNGVVIEDYPEDYPFPSALISGYYGIRALHAVVAYDQKNNEIVIITAYEPDEIHFEADRMRRRQ